MIRFISLLLFLTTAVFAEDLTHLDEIEKGKVVYGKAVKAKELKGKVILFEYWGFN
jgi:hypothetical protein